MDVIQESFLRESKEYLREIENILTKPDDLSPRARREAIFRYLHSMKGMAGFMGLEAMVSALHAAEGAVENGGDDLEVDGELADKLERLVWLSRQSVEGFPADLEVASEKLRVLAGQFERMLETGSSKPKNSSPSPVIGKLEASGPNTEAKGVDSVRQHLSKLDGDIEPNETVSIGVLDEVLGDIIDELERQTSKNIEYVSDRDDVYVASSVVRDLLPPLIHLVRNAVDHGIETEGARRRKGKSEMGTVQLESCVSEGSLRVALRDDGGGLDADEIGNRALEKGLVTHEELQSMSQNEIYEFILAPGLSTAAEVGPISGRGVGLDAVKSKLDSLEGDISVRSRPGIGTEFVLEIPL